ncbi:MAG: HAD-IA family hydrolase [Pseudomonadota bacterium]|nr:HAD-IA family hydrolase [Pseudomonadota bacterium]
MPVLQGLIFDLDGTLVDSAPDLRQALNRTLRAHGRRDVSLEEVTRMVGDGMLPLLSRAFAITGEALPDSQSYVMFQEFIGHYRNQHADPAQIYPHAIETLEHFKTLGIQLGICTNKQEAATLHLLEELKLKHYFACVAGGDTFPVHKPHGGHVTGVIEGLGVAAVSCVMIGDGPHDVTAAHSAGLPCLVITHGYGSDFASLGGDAVIDGFRQLPEALRGLGFAVKP